MQSTTVRKWLSDGLIIILGDLLLAVAIIAFLEPQNLVTGGVSGIAIIVEDYTGRLGYAVPIWLTNLALNIPLFLLGIKAMGRAFLVKTAFATFFLSVALYLVGFIPLIEMDITLAAVFGGVFSGVGLGLVFRVMATTGGTDLAASLIRKRFMPHISIPRILFVLDSAIILLGLLVFGPVPAMYAVVAVYVTTKVTDTLLEGLSFSKAAFIISDESERIAESVMQKLDRGATGLNGQGMYTRREKNVLLCVVSAKELVRLKEIVHALDTGAFMIVADVREVLGDGFTKNDTLL